MPIDLATRKLLDFPGRTYGYRIDYGGRSVVFSGDTRSSQAVLQQARGADVLVHEVQVPSPGETREARLANVSLSVHAEPEEVGRLFAAAKPRLAVYSHIIPPDVTSDELLAATRPFYDGPLVVGHDLMMITIGERIEVSDRPRIAGETFEKSGVIK
jgi:ribonuclease Z